MLTTLVMTIVQKVGITDPNLFILVNINWSL